MYVDDMFENVESVKAFKENIVKIFDEAASSYTNCTPVLQN